MTPEQRSQELQSAFGSALRSVVLYGSAAAGDFLQDVSDYNVLVVIDRVGVAELDALVPISAKWARDGNRPPVLMSAWQLRASADAFPIEMLDMQSSRKVLAGEDVLASIKVPREALRLQVERELNAALLHLRETYLRTGGKPARVANLLVESLSTFLVLARAALRLYQDEVPHKKLDALSALARHIPFSPRPFETVQQWKAERRTLKQEAASVFQEYLSAVEQIVEAVDRLIHREPSQGEPTS
jgi:predicted nucleotidyltransferase